MNAEIYWSCMNRDMSKIFHFRSVLQSRTQKYQSEDFYGTVPMFVAIPHRCNCLPRSLLQCVLIIYQTRRLIIYPSSVCFFPILEQSNRYQWRIYIVKFWTRPPPRGSKFFQFHAVFGKFWRNRMLAPPPGGGAPSSEKS